MKGMSVLGFKKSGAAENEISVLLVGNNPIEMSTIYESLFALKDKIKSIETAFSEADTLQKIGLIKPNCLIVDDNLGLKPLKILIDKVNSLNKSSISITLLKSINKEEITSGVQEYLLKEGISSEKIYNSLRNAIRFKKTQQFFKIKYYSGKKKVKRVFI
ncbi:hypothetical protein [Marivirga sp.]|uniref:hypothetical protein n=1 Tax=Marivirga sp. TaxID=2018662 RepID=UPI002D7F499F|nr:hypothetical protein [Marivirga sp.]HET8859372.1 hypothetical protein [Marivirga sp.]